MALLQSHLTLEHWKPHKAARHPSKCLVINDIKLFPTVYHRIYVANVWLYPVRRHVSKASALELRFNSLIARTK